VSSRGNLDGFAKILGVNIQRSAAELSESECVAMPFAQMKTAV